MPAPPPWLEQDPKNPKVYRIAGDSKKVLVHIFSEFAKGRSKADICRGLKNDRLNLANPESPWDTSRVSKLLKDKRLLGVPEKGFPPVISAELFERVQTRTEARKGLRGSKSDNTSNLFQGLLFCGYCGKRMKPSPKVSGGKKKTYYACPDSLSGKCIAPEIEAIPLEDRVTCILEEWCDERAFIRDPKLLEELQVLIVGHKYAIKATRNRKYVLPDDFLIPLTSTEDVSRAFDNLLAKDYDAVDALIHLRDRLLPFTEATDNQNRRKGTQIERQLFRQFIQKHQVRFDVARYLKPRRGLSIVISFPNRFALRCLTTSDSQNKLRRTIYSDGLIRSGSHEAFESVVDFLESRLTERMGLELSEKKRNRAKRLKGVNFRIKSIRDSLFKDKGSHPLTHSPAKRILRGTASKEEVRHFREDAEELEDLLRQQRALRIAKISRSLRKAVAVELKPDPRKKLKKNYDEKKVEALEEELTRFLRANEKRILDLTRKIARTLDYALNHDLVMFSDKHTVIEKVIKYKHLLKEEKYKHMIGKEITDKRRVMRNWNRYKRQFLQTRHVRFERQVLEEILAAQNDLS